MLAWHFWYGSTKSFISLTKCCSQHSILIDFNSNTAARATGMMPRLNSLGELIRTYTAFQFWNYLDDALTDVREESAKEDRTLEQQWQWLAR
jgi:hypothetical protein